MKDNLKCRIGKILERYKIWLGWSFISILIIVGFPFIMDKLIVGNDVPSNISNSEWVSFLGSYVGAILGSIASVAGIIITIEYTKKETSKDREIAEDRLREDRRLSKAPFIIESFKKDYDSSLTSRGEILIKWSLPEEGGTYVEDIGYIILTNIGNGAVLNPIIITAEIKSNNNHSLEGTFVEFNAVPITRSVLTNNSLVIAIRLSSALFIMRNMLNEFTLTFTIQYFDVMNFRYRQKIKMEFFPVKEGDPLITVSGNISELDRLIEYRANERTLETSDIEITPK
ncbi:hypothetical protein [Jeotgalibaca sp. A122]|uniref:hypothetical protein n=1 Tax=Jeotgalibaca sp. A122 TaxID=3457322 RepID=UPI003FD69984